MDQTPESTTKQIGNAVGDAFVSEAVDAAFEFAFKALGEALSYGCEVAAGCGEVAVKVTCEIAGHALDGI